MFRKGLVVLFILLLSSVNALEYAFTTALTTPNTTESLFTWDDGEFLDMHTLQYVVTGIDTNIVMRAEGSLDGTNFFNLDFEDADYTYTADGAYTMYLSRVKLKAIRARLVSETGGTNATVNVKYIGGNL